jgi:phosphohistidine swiveling domain-containing protein
MNLAEQQLADKILDQRQNYSFWLSRPSSIQRDEIVRLFLNPLVGADYLAFVIEGNNTGFFMQTKKQDRFYHDFGLKLLEPKFARQHLKNYQRFARKLLQVSRQAVKVKAERKSLANFQQKWLKALGDYSLYFLTPYLIENQFEPQLKELLKKEFPARAEEFFSIIAYPTIVFAYQKYQLDLLQMGDKIDYDQLIKKYGWLPEYSYQEELLNQVMIDQEVNNIKKNNLAADIAQIFQKAATNLEAYKKIVKAMKGKTELLTLVELLHNYVNIRTERIEFFKQAQTQLRSFYQTLTNFSQKQLPDIQYLDIVNLTDREIQELLDGKVIFKLADVRNRVNKQFVCYGQLNQEPQFIYEPNLISLIREAYTKSEQAESFKGVVSYPGKVTGIVKIVLEKTDFAKFQDDDILVAQFTTPDYVPLMKKAKAIITNDGGITCHAAIISRELKKPCVVGTKIATKVLKDGDMVQVDADKGIVKILN